MTALRLPEWDLTDLYPAMDAPELDADFATADRRAAAFAEKYAGGLADLSGDALAGAIAEYAAISEIAGRIGS